MTFEMIAESIFQKVQLHYTNRQSSKPLPSRNEIIKYINNKYTSKNMDKFYVDIIAEGIIEKINNNKFLIKEY